MSLRSAAMCGCAAAVFVSMSLVVPMPALGELPAPMHMHDKSALIYNTDCTLGDFLCNHAYFHDFYKMVELINGKDCCHNNEGRPTKTIIDATPMQRQLGFSYQAWVDGQYCPATLEALTRFTETDREKLKVFPDKERLLRFFEYDHAFAPASTITNEGGVAVTHCPTIYCIWKNPGPV